MSYDFAKCKQCGQMIDPYRQEEHKCPSNVLGNKLVEVWNEVYPESKVNSIKELDVHIMRR